MDYDEETRYVLQYSGIFVDIDLPESPITFRRILPKFPLTYVEMELEDTDGAYVRYKEKHYIYINSLRPLVRRRFSIGHEFGHYYLGHPSDVTVEVKALQDKRKESQANHFSAALLMPSDPLYRVHQVRYSIAEIADWFRVSDISAAIRLQELGLRTNECELVISDYRMQARDPVWNES